MGVCGGSQKKGDEDVKPTKKPVKISQLSETEKALMDCKKVRDQIKAYIKRLEDTARNKKEKAKELLKNKDRDRAKVYLRQSKYHSEQIKVAEGQLSMIEDQIANIQTTSEQVEVLKVLQNGNKVLKQLQSEIKIEKWQEVADDLEDLKEKQAEMNEFFDNHNINAEKYDEEVEAEFHKIENDLGLSEKIDLPDANKDEIQVPKQKEERKEKAKAMVEA